ncbi:hypothetical protein VD0004_g1455 [Verticillium dahliae]|uniref:SAP domain-containing protein n=1 Tax=Verticillium dahliae TaxID=27337 RepID=A0A444S8H0_VERDA|nr:hypothetical protein VD0004_g1455 [Verticillium dahliae]PNH71495.1 hypothetical protein VD0001_g6055 [Verticillium dahliae]RXG49698.1 hypothetical protein VDGE_00349 [Verticillium dahliae]
MADWNKSKVVDLRNELKRRGLPHAGLKQELVQRLDEDDEQTATSGDAKRDEASETGSVLIADDQESAAANEDSTSAPALATDALDAPAIAATQDGAPANSEYAEPKNITTEPIAVDDNGSNDITTPAAAPQESEVVQDAQKRKRRSTSPPPEPKRIKATAAEIHEEEVIPPVSPEGTEQHISPNSGVEQNTLPDSGQVAERLDDHEMHDIPTNDQPANSPGTINVENEQQPVRQPSPTPEARGRLAIPEQQADFQPSHNAPTDTMDFERNIEPAAHPATRALYIKNFMRPLRAPDVKQHLLDLASSQANSIEESAIEIFYLDQIRTHAFAVFSDTSKAMRVRSELHNVIWPDESNRKPLWVDFVPPEKVHDWILEEEPETGRRASASSRWEIRYERDHDGNVVAVLDSGTAPTPALANSAPPNRPSRPMPPLGPSGTSFPPSGPGGGNSVNAIPIGPRAGRGGREPPLGPRGPSDTRGPGGRTPGFASGPLRTTSTNPPLTFQTVSEDLARQRVDSMRSHYTRDIHRDMGTEDEINRYTFESGDVFVDRGKEVFIGIRPPHREAERQRQLTEGGSYRRPGPGPRGPPRRGPRGPGGPGGRPLSDRYLPGINESGPFRQGDRGNFSRREDDRFGDSRRPGGRRDDRWGGGGGGGGGYRGRPRY